MRWGIPLNMDLQVLYFTWPRVFSQFRVLNCSVKLVPGLDPYWVGSCEYNSEPLGSVKGREFLDQLSNNHFPKKDFAWWS
jgi:hypothetical protein